MARATATRIAKRLGESLQPAGFAPEGSCRLNRQTLSISQFIEIQSGARSLADQLTVNFGWQFIADGQSDPRTYDFLANLGHLMRSSEYWINVGKEDSDTVVTTVERQIRDYGLPFLDRYQDIRVMLDAYEAAAVEPGPITTPLDPRQFFGIDGGWKNFQLAFAYKTLGNRDKARQHFEKVISRYSSAPIRHVQDRKQRCQAALLELA